MKKDKLFCKIILSIVGLISLAFILSNYEYSKLISELIKISKNNMLFVIFISFAPVLLCYSLSWMIITDGIDLKKGGFFKNTIAFWIFMTISIAWNNLTPFLKVGGEPLKFIILSKNIGNRNSLSSTINYNIIHIISTLISFLFFSGIILTFFELNHFMFSMMTLAFILLLAIIILFFYGIFKGDDIFKVISLKRKSTGRKIVLNIRLAVRRLRWIFIYKHRKLFLSIFFDTMARFVEGLTFYFTFRAIGEFITLGHCVLIDVGRALVDNIFFFIPFQLGAREEGVSIIMKSLLQISDNGFLTAVLVYRMVEIAWIVVGYIFWIILGNSKREFKIISASTSP